MDVLFPSRTVMPAVLSHRLTFDGSLPPQKHGGTGLLLSLLMARQCVITNHEPSYNSPIIVLHPYPVVVQLMLVSSPRDLEYQWRLHFLPAIRH